MGSRPPARNQKETEEAEAQFVVYICIEFEFLGVREAF